jgi:hypothetical protein
MARPQGTVTTALFLFAAAQAVAQDGCRPWFRHPQVDSFYTGGFALVDLDPQGWPALVGNAYYEGLEIWRLGPEGLVARAGRVGEDLGVGLLAADFDGDGDTDLLARHISTDAVHIFTNRAGTLVEGPGTEIAGLFELYLACDFDLDGLPDLVVSAAGNIVVLRNAGDGTFTAPVGLPLGNIDRVLPAAIDLGGAPGMFVVTRDEVTPIRYLADGSLQALTPTEIDYSGLGEYLCGDIDGDGLSDLLYDDRRVLLGRGQGALVEGPELDARVVGVRKLADIDLDGDLDLLANAERAGGDFSTAYTLLNDGAGGFTLLDHDRIVSSHPVPKAVIVDDVNGDGRPDLVAQRGNLIDLRFGSGDGHFDHVPLQIFFEGVLRRASLGDMDNDGDLDVVATGDDPQAALKVLANDGSGSFAIAAAMAAPSTIYERTPLADFDGDGDLDILAWTAEHGLWFYENTPDGFYSQVHILPHPAGGPTEAPIVADLDRNGRLDIVVGDSDGESRGYSVYFDRAGWDFTRKFYPAPQADHVLASADFDNDGLGDILCADTDGEADELLVCFGKGNWRFTDPEPTGVLGDESPYATPGDFNGDGWQDFIVYGWVAREVRVMINQRDGSFLHSATLDRYFAVRDPGVVDLDGDGFDELVCASQSSTRKLAGLFEFNAFGGVISEQHFGVGLGPPLGSPVGDLNGDDAPDILLVATRSTFGPGGVALCVSPCPGAPCMPDFNHDGALDTRDLVVYLGAWADQREGDCSDFRCPADLDRNGVIDPRDLVRFLGAWAAGC